MEITTFENFIDLSYIFALFLAAQFEKKFDLIGKIFKNGMKDQAKVAIIGFVHALVWIFLFNPEGVSLKGHVKIIVTSFFATVVLYDYFLKRFFEKYK